MFDKVLLMSGGVDSFIAYYLLGKPNIIYFDINSGYSEAEKANLLKMYPDIIIDNTLSFLGKMERDNFYIPYRNIFFMLIASLKYSHNVYLGGTRDDSMPDNNKTVYKIMSKLLSVISHEKVKITSPFWSMSKVDICQEFDRRFDGSLLLNTYSCYLGKEEECAKCIACFKKRVALFSVGIELPFYGNKVISDYKNNINKYTFQQQLSIKDYLYFLEKNK